VQQRREDPPRFRQLVGTDKVHLESILLNRFGRNLIWSNLSLLLTPFSYRYVWLNNTFI
jgi:hypothetical protein